MASTFKIVFDMTNNAEWTGTIPIIRLDFFDARNEPGSGPDYDAGDIDIDYIEVAQRTGLPIEQEDKNYAQFACGGSVVGQGYGKARMPKKKGKK